MKRKHIEISDYLVCWEWPYFTCVSTGLVHWENCDGFFFFSDDVELISLILKDYFLYLLIVRILFELFSGEFFVVEQNLIKRHKCNGRETDQLNDICDSIVFIWIFNFFAVILVFFLVSLDIVDPYLIGLVKTQPPIHHWKKEYLGNECFWRVDDLVQKHRAESLIGRSAQKVTKMNNCKGVVA